jgi:hypothetical protein
MHRFRPYQPVHVSDEVAIVRPHAWGNEIVAITRVKHIGHVLLETDDGRFYSASDGKSIGARQGSYLEPVTNEHRAQLRRHHQRQSPDAGSALMVGCG